MKSIKSRKIVCQESVVKRCIVNKEYWLECRHQTACVIGWLRYGSFDEFGNVKFKDIEDMPKCKKCGCWHIGSPYQDYMQDEGCPHDSKRKCISCGLPVGHLSMGGNNVCGRSDCGHSKKIPHW